MTVCPSCGSPLTSGLREWHRVCGACSYEGSSLEPHILEQQAEGDLDEYAREDALRDLRIANFDRLGNRVGKLLGDSSGKARTLLDVGCAHGWFLERMSRDFSVFGIEPDRLIAEVARRRGFEVRSGFFPDVVDGKSYDVIAFNDVLEHIPDVNKTLAACHDHLNAGGYVVVNAPDRKGFLYRLSKLMARAGLGNSFERMWQVGFPSPHVHYFDSESITRLASKAGFEVVDSFSPPTATYSGLYSRVRYDRSVSALKAFVMTGVLGLMIPFLTLLPADIRVWMLQKKGS